MDRQTHDDSIYRASIALHGKNDFSYQHQTYTYTLWQNLSMHWPWGQKVKGQGHRVMKHTAVTGMHVNMIA